MTVQGEADVQRIVFRHRHAVTVPAGPAGDGSVPARQLDAVLMTLGYKASGELMSALSLLDPGTVIDLAVQVLGWARELAGAHATHNVYFAEFPKNVPDTYEFWAGLLADAARQAAVSGGRVPAAVQFSLNLLELPGYGRYQHTYTEMLALHTELVPALGDRVTVIHLTGSGPAEAGSLFAELAGSAVPLSGDRLDDLRVLAVVFAEAAAPVMPVRENKAVVNAARVRAGHPPATDGPTDVLRLAVELAGGDVTLTRPTRFPGIPNAHRRMLLAALEQAVRWDEQLGEVPARAEAWKRLQYRLHPSPKTAGERALAVFKVARGEYPARSLTSQAEGHLTAGDTIGAAWQLSKNPGLLWRSADRLIRVTNPADLPPVMRRFELTAPQVSARVLLGVRQHLVNRARRGGGLPRMFPNRRGRAWVTPDLRLQLDPLAVTELITLIDEEISRRLPAPGHLVVDPAVRGAALPITGKPAAGGLGTWPRGSVTPVDGDTLRFFCHWVQNQDPTDYDLSALFLDSDWGNPRWVSYTSLTIPGAVHSGDLTVAPAPGGASEFINIELPRFSGYVIPQVYVFAGESFNQAAEVFTGYMSGDAAQQGLPFEPRLVRAMSPLTGDSRIAIPAVFYRGEDGRWRCKWLHLYASARQHLLDRGARVEENKATVALHARMILNREYLTAGWLLSQITPKAELVTIWPAGEPAPELGEGPVTYVGPYRPEGLPEDSTVITLDNLEALIPR